MKESEDQFRSLAECMPHIVWKSDLAGSQLYVNDHFRNYFRREAAGYNELPDLVHADDLPALRAAFAAAQGKTGHHIEFESRLRRHDGVFRWHLLRVVPARDRDGAVRYWMGTATDIEDHKRTETNLARLVQDRTATLAGTVTHLQETLAEKTVLLQEVHHRVKNNLAVISSLLGMQADSTSDERARAALQGSQQRVHSMALIHEHLYGSEYLDRINFAEYATQLTEDLTATLAPEPGRIRVLVEAEPIELGVDQAIPCGLILNELLTNAFKYAFPGDRGGEVRVRFSVCGESRACLRVADDGVGLPDGLDWQHGSSLGLQIVTTLARQLGAEVLLPSRRGTCWEIAFPLQE